MRIAPAWKPACAQPARSSLPPVRALCAALPAAVLWPRRSEPGRRQLAHQGHHRLRGRARQPAGRLRPRGRPQRHRRFAAQLGVHRREPGGDARAPRRQHPRAGSQDQERRGGDGHRHPAAVRPPGLAPRRLGQRAGRCQVARGRHAAGDPALWRRRRDLCGQPGPAHDRRLRRPGRGRERHPRRADLGPDRRRRDRRARGRVRARPARAHPRSRCAIPTSRPPSGSPARSTTASTPPLARATDPATVALSVPPVYRGRDRGAADRDRAARGRARPAGPGR